MRGVPGRRIAGGGEARLLSHCQALSPALLNGPPPAKLQSYEKHLRQMYAEMKAYEKTHPKSVVPYTEDEFVKRDLAKDANQYRARAARALGDIGGPQAARALEQALKLPLDAVPSDQDQGSPGQNQVTLTGLLALPRIKVSAGVGRPTG